MFSPFERLIAFRYLRARKAEGLVSVIAGFSFLGIMLGVATLIIVMAVMNGFRSELITRILGLNGHLSVYAMEGPLDNYQSKSDKIRKLPGVTFTAPLIEKQVLLSARGEASGVVVRGIKRRDFAEKPVLSESLVSGKLEAFEDRRAAIGIELARRLNLHVGDQITLTSPKGKASPFGTIPRTGRFQVGQIFDAGMYEYNNGFIFIPFDMAQTFFQIPEGSANMLEVFTDRPQDVAEIKGQIATMLKGQAGVYDWRDANASFINALEVERNVMFLILTLIILVAAFNIISSQIMLVKDKGRDIAIMRTMGARRASMMKIFILTGASIGLAGTLVGAAAGVAFAANIEFIRQWLEGVTGTELFADEIYFLSRLPAEIDWGEVGAVIAMALSLSVLATLYPAWRAARLNPVEALRYE